MIKIKAARDRLTVRLIKRQLGPVSFERKDNLIKVKVLTLRLQLYFCTLRLQSLGLFSSTSSFFFTVPEFFRNVETFFSGLLFNLYYPTE